MATAEAIGTDALGVVLHGLQALRDGDLSVRLPVEWTGTSGKVARLFNELVESRGLESRANGQTNGIHGGLAIID